MPTSLIYMVVSNFILLLLAPIIGISANYIVDLMKWPFFVGYYLIITPILVNLGITGLLAYLDYKKDLIKL